MYPGWDSYMRGQRARSSKRILKKAIKIFIGIFVLYIIFSLVVFHGVPETIFERGEQIIVEDAPAALLELEVLIEPPPKPHCGPGTVLIDDTCQIQITPLSDDNDEPIPTLPVCGPGTVLIDGVCQVKVVDIITTDEPPPIKLPVIPSTDIITDNIITETLQQHHHILDKIQNAVNNGYFTAGYIGEHGSILPLTIQYTVLDVPAYYSESSAKDAILNAVNSWALVNPGLYFQYVNEKEDADFIITWKYIAPFDRVGDATLGTGLDTIRVWLAEHDCRGNFIYMDQNMLTNTMAHEVGHILGLGHHLDENHLMYSPYDGINESEYVTLGLSVPSLPEGGYSNYKELELEYNKLNQELSFSSSIHDYNRLINQMNNLVNEMNCINFN